MTASEPPASPPPAASPRTSGATMPVLVWAFLLELAAFGALGYAGWQLGPGIVSLLLVFALPVAAIVVWALFVAPRARVALPPPARFAVELLVYAAAVVGLLAAGAVAGGLVLAVLVVAFQLVRSSLRRRGVRVTG